MVTKSGYVIFLNPFSISVRKEINKTLPISVALKCVVSARINNPAPQIGRSIIKQNDQVL